MGNRNAKRFVLALAAGLLAVSGAAFGATNTLVCKKVSYAPYRPSLMGYGGCPNAGASAVDAIASGDIGTLGALLDSGRVGINEVIAFSIQGSGTMDTTQAAWILTDRDFTRPPAGDPMHVPFMAPAGEGNQAGWSAPVGGNPMMALDFIQLHGTPLMVAARFGNARIVQYLLDRGANPNVFVQVGGASNGEMDLYCERQQIVRPWLFALSEAYRRTAFRAKTQAKMDEIAGKLIAAGAILPPEDGFGRNGLWDAAIARSVPMLELAVAGGLDIAGEDYSGHSVGECAPRFGGDGAWEAFRREIGNRGGSVGPEDGTEFENGFGDEAPRPSLPAPNVAPPPVSTPMPGMEPGFGRVFPGAGTPGNTEDHSAEIACLESQLKQLHLQLLEARHDVDMAVQNGTGWIAASQRVSNLQQAISDTESRLAELQR